MIAMFIYYRCMSCTVVCGQCICVFALIDTNVLFLLLCVVGSDSWSQWWRVRIMQIRAAVINLKYSAEDNWTVWTEKRPSTSSSTISAKKTIGSWETTICLAPLVNPLFFLNTFIKIIKLNALQRYFGHCMWCNRVVFWFKWYYWVVNWMKISVV